MKFLVSEFMMRKIVFGLVLLFFQLVSAQEITVRDADTQEPIVNIAVYNLRRALLKMTHLLLILKALSLVSI